ncbi:hypothetical protein LXT21_31925 [Myxococcus sp. K38C18041901]|uniref:hypothetical protein n=1 Tax=Myxococcus guangdongensis TaxID=2906760 RepID=UPI0020A72E12|nr:hypothetical protein [Myxococcus guangdongensis]MCP3063398.1 hypothetical protein [Myxococcus guangdongensis]
MTNPDPASTPRRRVLRFRVAGYFRELSSDDSGEPSRVDTPSIVEARGKLSEAHRIRAAPYLGGGRVFVVSSGFENDWFRGTQHIAERISRTDGSWIWPDSLAHYVAIHRVALPEEFLQHMQSHQWACPFLTDEEMSAFGDVVSEDLRNLQKLRRRHRRPV